MTVKVAINGYGRIGRTALRAIYEHGYRDRIQVVAINSSHPAETTVHLTKYDTTHGRFNADVTTDGEYMIVNGDKIKLYASFFSAIAKPTALAMPWPNGPVVVSTPGV